MPYDQSAQDGKVISLAVRSDARIVAGSGGARATIPRPPTRDAVAKALDALLVAQFELCGNDPHPTRASLSETRFRQARQALEDGIAILKRLIESADLPAPTSVPALTNQPVPPRPDEIYAAD
jgi:hypothetical protein